MHRIITDGAPASRREHLWWLLDDAERAWRDKYRRPEPERVLRWASAPDRPEVIEALAIVARGYDAALPPWVADLAHLRLLEMPIRFLRDTERAALPPSLDVLSVLGTNAVTVPRSLTLSSITFLLSDTGTLKFTRENFPSLRRLSLGLDRPQEMLSVVGRYTELVALHLSGVYAPDLFERIADLRLEYLGLVNGKLDSLSGIGALGALKSLQIKNLPRLTSLAGLEVLEELEELSIGYCHHLEGVKPLVELPKLKRLMLFGVGRVGVDEIRATLEQKGLEQLSLGGAT